MKRKKTKQITLLLVVMLLVWSNLLATVSASPTSKQSIHFVALGDSYAAGTLYNLSSGHGFNDVIADVLAAEGKLASYTKEFTKNGYTTTDVLEQLKNEEIISSIKEANFITLSIGGNDLLKLFSFDQEKGTVQLNQEDIQPTLLGMSKRLSEILLTIQTISPEAKIYVFGYPFAFPHSEGLIKLVLSQASKALNTSIKLTTERAGATYVNVDNVFGDNAKTYFPNPLDIHPSEEGYLLIAEQFLAQLFAPNFTLVDVSNDHWAYTEITQAAMNGLLTVSEDGKVYPNQAVTRAEIALALANFLPLEEVSPVKPNFTDISPDNPAYTAISSLTELGIFANVDLFNPDQPMTRAQMAKVITLAFGLQLQEEVSFIDVETNHWAYGPIQVVASNKIIRGFSNGSYQPSSKVTRAEFAVIASRLLNISLD